MVDEERRDYSYPHGDGKPVKIQVVADDGELLPQRLGLHTLALKTDGSVVARGYGASGQTNVPVEALSGVTAITVELYHSAALKNDGSVVAWGDDAEGQATVPADLSGVIVIAGGSLHSVAIIPASVGVLPVPSNVNRVGHELILTWPGAATGFTLESTPDLTPPATWTDVTNVPALLGGQ